MKDVVKNFLVNRDKTGKEIMFFPETGKKYFIEWIGGHTSWGDFDPATKKFTGSYGDKYTGSINEKDSVITKENGFVNIVEGKGSAYGRVIAIHDKWKKENGYV